MVSCLQCRLLWQMKAGLAPNSQSYWRINKLTHVKVISTMLGTGQTLNTLWLCTHLKCLHTVSYLKLTVVHLPGSCSQDSNKGPWAIPWHLCVGSGARAEARAVGALWPVLLMICLSVPRLGFMLRVWGSLNLFARLGLRSSYNVGFLQCAPSTSAVARTYLNDPDLQWFSDAILWSLGQRRDVPASYSVSVLQTPNPWKHFMMEEKLTPL